MKNIPLEDAFPSRWTRRESAMNADGEPMQPVATACDLARLQCGPGEYRKQSADEAIPKGWRTVFEFRDYGHGKDWECRVIVKGEPGQVYETWKVAEKAAKHAEAVARAELQKVSGLITEDPAKASYIMLQLKSKEQDQVFQDMGKHIKANRRSLAIEITVQSALMLRDLESSKWPATLRAELIASLPESSSERLSLERFQQHEDKRIASLERNLWHHMRSLEVKRPERVDARGALEMALEKLGRHNDSHHVDYILSEEYVPGPREAEEIR